jgi:hypothetical protein
MENNLVRFDAAIAIRTNTVALQWAKRKKESGDRVKYM